MAVKAVNNTTSLNGLVPTLFVYGAYLKINNLDPPAPSITDQATAIQKTKKMVQASQLIRVQAGLTTLYRYMTATYHHIMAIYRYLPFSVILCQYCDDY